MGAFAGVATRSAAAGAREGRQRLAPWAPAVCAALIPVGVLAFVVHPKLGLLGLASLVAPLLVLSPGHALLLLIAALPTDAVASLGPPGTATVTRILGMGVMAGWAVHVLLHRRRLRLGAPGGLLGAYIAFSAVSLLWTPDLQAGLAALQLSLQLFVFYVMIANLLTSWTSVLRAVDVLLLATTVLAFFLLWQLPGLSGPRATVRLGDEAFNPNALAGVLVLPVFLGMLLGRQSTAWWRGLAVVPLVVAALVTGSRGGTMALLFGALVLIVGRPRALVQMAAMALAIGTVAVAFVPHERLEALGDRYEKMSSDRGSGRIDIWKVGVGMVEAQPVFGVGLAGFQPAFYRYMSGEDLDPEWAREARNRYGKRVAHNVLLQAVAELGVIGLSLLIAALVAHARVIWREFRAAQSTGRRDHATLALGLACTFAVLLGLSVNGDVLATKSAWMVLALIQAVALIGADERRRAIRLVPDTMGGMMDRRAA